MYKLILCTTLLLNACGTAPKTIAGPDGTDHLLISCGSIENCYSKATESCGGKYKIVNTNSDTYGTRGTTFTSFKLLVKCESNPQPQTNKVDAN